jgi:PPOX class probable F420-dependent enzyme
MNDPLVAFRNRRSYLALTSFRKDGSDVTTTVWVVEDGNRLLMRTDSTSHKVGRMRTNPSVRIAASDGRGQSKHEPILATARELPLSDRAYVEKLIARKYPVGYWTEIALWRPLHTALAAVGIGKRRGSPLLFEIVPEGAPVAGESASAETGKRRWTTGLAPVLPLMTYLEALPVELI